jgi:hypothetical protein
VIRRPVERYVNALVCRTALFVLGFWNIDNSYVSSVNRMQLVSTSDRLFGTVNHGDLIICNHASYVELLYLAFRYSPTFATVVETDSKKNDDRIALIKQGLFGALLSTIDERRTKNVDASSTQTLSDIIKYSKENKTGPVVVFPEAVTSNGKAILAFQNSLFHPSIARTLSDLKSKVLIIAFKYNSSNFSPAFHQTSGLLSHLYGLTTQFYNTLVVKHICLSVTEQQQLVSEFYPETIRGYLKTVSNLQLVASSMKVKNDFQEYWNKTQNKNYVATTDE